MDLEKLFNPASVAIVGASEEEGTVGNVLAKNILTLGYQGKIYLVNPKHETILGQKCYKSLIEISEPVDLAVVAIPAKFVVSEIEKNADKIKNYIIISAGFSEIGPEGKEREEALKKIADEKNLNILGPNCLGVINPHIKLNATFAGGMPTLGNIALVSQSGALLVAIMDIAQKVNMKFSLVISVGNKMDVDEAEMLDYLAHDEKTRVIGMYLEGIKNGQKFIAKAADVSRIKPIIILKVGKTQRAQQAITSHTGALAGSDDIVTAAFSKAGILRADSMEEFFSLLSLTSQAEAPKNNTVAIITNAGGPGVIATDAFQSGGIKLFEISDKLKTKLSKILPEESALGNPIDVLGDAHEDRYKKVLGILAKEDVGSYLTILTPQDQTPVGKIATKLIQFKNKNKVLVTASFIGGKRVEKAVGKLQKNNIPCFNLPDQAVPALDKFNLWAAWKNKSRYQANETIDEGRKKLVLNILAKPKAEERKVLYYGEAAAIMNIYGIRTADYAEAKAGQISLSNINFPVVLKLDSYKFLHKTDKKGLALNIKNQEELDQNITRLAANFPGERLIVQPELPRKVELIIGIKRNTAFGPVIVYGLGGIYTEVLKVVNFLVPPLTIEEIKDELLQSKISFLFRETRGQSPYNLDELAGILGRLNQAAQEIEDIHEFDINPLLIYNNGKEATAVDIKLLI